MRVSFFSVFIVNKCNGNQRNVKDKFHSKNPVFIRKTGFLNLKLGTMNYSYLNASTGSKFAARLAG